jgi:hypothetical protein
VSIDDDDLIEAVRNLNEANRTAHADHLRPELQRVAQEDYEPSVIVAALDALVWNGRLRRCPDTEWAFQDPECRSWIESGEPLPAYRVAYALVDDKPT